MNSGNPSPTRQQTGGQAETTNDRRFNLEKTKMVLFTQIEDGCSSRFKAFFKSYQFDRFLHTCILYFVSFFQLQALQRSGKGSRSEILTLKREMHFQLSELSPVYAIIIMAESDYEHTHQDKKFFEGLYETTTEILLQAFPGQRRQAVLEEELGRVLRTNQFNTPANKRRSKDHISQSNLTIRELYSLKHEGDPSLNSRTLADLYQKKVNQGSVTLASVSNSPLIGNVIVPLDDKSGGDSDGRPVSRMPWKMRSKPFEDPRPPTSSMQARDSFVKFQRDSPSSTPKQKEKVEAKQRNMFDDGLHRGNILSRGSSAASSRVSSGRIQTPDGYTSHDLTPPPSAQRQYHFQ